MALLNIFSDIFRQNSFKDEISIILKKTKGYDPHFLIKRNSIISMALKNPFLWALLSIWLVPLGKRSFKEVFTFLERENAYLLSASGGQVLKMIWTDIYFIYFFYLYINHFARHNANKVKVLPLWVD